MERTAVKSSNIVSIGHDPVTNVMEVEFKNGGVFRYASVPAEKHSALMSAESLGSHFHQHIKNGGHSCEKC